MGGVGSIGESWDVFMVGELLWEFAAGEDAGEGGHPSRADFPPAWATVINQCRQTNPVPIPNFSIFRFGKFVTDDATVAGHSPKMVGKYGGGGGKVVM